MKIKVNYPTHERVVVKTEAEMRALGYTNYKGDLTKSVYPNREHSIIVRTAKPQFSPEELCLQLTGMRPSEYQSKYGVAWND